MQSDTPTGNAELVKRLRARTVMEYEGTCGVPFPDRDCHEAADALEAAERRAENLLNDALTWKGMYLSAAKERDDLLARHATGQRKGGDDE